MDGVTLSQIHPVLDHRNKPIQQPNAFDINTSIQRCLVKAIALHGLGLYVYAGEDLPPDVKAEQEDGSAKPITPEQAAELAELIRETETDEDKFLRFFKIGKLADLPADTYPRAKAMLAKKKEAA